MSFIRLKLSKKLPILFPIVGLLAFILVGVLGPAHFGGMNINEKGQMSGCLFTGKVEVCTMSFASHLNQWQGMFTTTSPKIDSLILLAYLLALAIIIFASQRSRAVLASEASASSKFYTKQSFYIPIFNPIKEAFSQGILNPKIYDSAVI